MEHRDIRTDIIRVDGAKPEPTVIELAAELLRGGEIVVFPTETVYGLGADAFQVVALERIFSAKGRPFSDPLIIHIADVRELELLTTRIPPEAMQLAKALWPGPLTLILPKSPRVPHLATSGLETVAVRMPRHPVAVALINALGSPIAAPSANRFMHVSPTTARHVFTDLAGKVPVILDSGPSEIGVESTVLDLSSDEPKILRPGGVSFEDLSALLPDVKPPISREYSEVSDDNLAKKAPGQMLVHYAPKVPLLLFDGTHEEMHTSMLAEVERRHAKGEQVGILLAEEDIQVFQDHQAFVYSVGRENDLIHVAAHLFAGLRSLEEADVQVILCRNFGNQGLGLAIRDRLLKAAGGTMRR